MLPLAITLPLPMIAGMEAAVETARAYISAKENVESKKELQEKVDLPILSAKQVATLIELVISI